MTLQASRFTATASKFLSWVALGAALVAAPIAARAQAADPSLTPGNTLTTYTVGDNEYVDTDISVVDSLLPTGFDVNTSITILDSNSSPTGEDTLGWMPLTDTGDIEVITLD